MTRIQKEYDAMVLYIVVCLKPKKTCHSIKRQMAQLTS